MKNNNNMDECMQLLIKPDTGCEEVVKEYYSNHGTFHDGDAGLDLFCLEDLTVPPRAYSVKMPLGVCMEAFYKRETPQGGSGISSYGGQQHFSLGGNVYVGDSAMRWKDSGSSDGQHVRQPTGFYLYPRSSTGSRTPIRLSNSVGIVDSGYRGPLTAILDNVSDQPFVMHKGERYFQVCAPNLTPISFTVVDQLSDTTRGEGGFGSTGN